MKRVAKNDYLLTDNEVLVNNKKDNSETVSDQINQKPNGKLLGFPLRLHIYNLARPNIDSILKAKIYDNPRKVSWKTKLLSKKQLNKDLESRKGINKWLKKTGEAPVIVNEEKTKKTTENLRKYFFAKGWFDVKTSYNIDKTENQRASITYNIVTGQPHTLDSITEQIESPIINSLYQQQLKQNSLLKKGEQYDASNFKNERDRLTSSLRNSGLYYFDQDYISFNIDTINATKKVNTELLIKNRAIRNGDSTVRKPFKIYKIKNVNIYTDYQNRGSKIKDSTTYNNFNLYSFNKLNYRPKALTDAVFISKGEVFKDIDRTRTYRYLSELQAFRYPSITYVENKNDTTLTANIFLVPKKKYDLGFDFDVTQSNIQTLGFSFRTGLIIRNIFRGAENLEISVLGAIGASKDASETKDAFFDINELGADLKLTIPRIFSPFNTDKIIPKYMSPTTRISLGATSQKNIGLDKQTINGLFNYKWNPSTKITNNFGLFNIQFIKNVNSANYFNVYNSSYDSLNSIAQNIGYTTSGLSIPEGTNAFINDVFSGNTTITPESDDFSTILSISERQFRLTQDNLIFASNFTFSKNNRENLYDENFSLFKTKLELAGNLFSALAKPLNFKKNDTGNYQIFGVEYSQYVKAEVDYVKHWSLGGTTNNVLALRTFGGIAIPFGNSKNIPFSKSYYGGGANDNRAWEAYKLGPGKSQSILDFNEANLKLALNVEYRFDLAGKFKGALFADTGNIWNVFDNIGTDDTEFKGISSLKDIAIGSGFGLRYDFSFFVLRGDIGFKTYEPSRGLGNRWFKNYNFANAVYNIGLNYPF